MRVALAVFIGALLFLAASIAGIDITSGASSNGWHLVVLGDPIASKDRLSTDSPTTTTIARPVIVETVEPGIEHYENLDDYYRDDDDDDDKHGKGDGDGTDLEDVEEVDTDLDDLEPEDDVDDDGLDEDKLDGDQKDNSGKGSRSREGDGR